MGCINFKQKRQSDESSQEFYDLAAGITEQPPSPVADADSTRLDLELHNDDRSSPHRSIEQVPSTSGVHIKLERTDVELHDDQSDESHRSSDQTGDSASRSSGETSSTESGEELIEELTEENLAALENERFSLWYRHSGEAELEEMPEYPTSKPDMTMSEIRQDVGDNFITHISIMGVNSIPPLYHIAPHLRHLSLLYAKNTDQQLNRLTNLDKLETLRLDKVNLGNDLPGVITDMINLKELALWQCSLKTINKRIGQLCNLEKLDISNNRLNSGTLPSGIYQLTRLKELRAEYCGLRELNDDRFLQLENLECLHLNGNDFTQATNQFDAKTLMSNLFMQMQFGSTQSWLHQTKEPANPVPALIYKLTKLRELHLALCDFTEIGDSISNLEHLEVLNISNRKDSADTTSNRNKAVCKDGLRAIKKYYLDLSEDGGIELPIISIAVIGNRMAGKTSLIQTLKSGKRVLTYRNKEGVGDDTTKVFNIEEVGIGSTHVKVFDFGGDKVYHISYQMTIRDNYIPIIVVDIAEFDRRATEKENIKEAARQLCMDFMSHLYLSCPKLGAPILVLTHKDCLSEDIFSTCKNQLLEALEQMRKEMLEEERKFSKCQSKFCDIAHFQNEDRPIFEPSDIFVFSGDLSEISNIEALIDCLLNRCKGHMVRLPRLWEMILSFLEENQDKPFLELEKILAEFPSPGDGNMVVLRYMHSIGRVLWFERDETLSHIVFHKVSEITSVIAVLFHHRNDDQWKERIEGFRPFEFEGGKIISGQKYEELVKDFQASGVIDGAVLHTLYNDGSVPMDVALKLLLSFYIICGPIESGLRATYIIPYLSENHIDIPPLRVGILRLQVDILFIGLSPPAYVYYLLVVTYLNLYNEPGNKITAGKNGASVHHGNTVSRVVHDSSSRKITVLVDTSIGQLDASWAKMIEIVEEMLKRLMILWIAARPICKFFCAHCIYSNIENPDCEIDPDWYTPPTNTELDPPLNRRLYKFRGVDPVRCRAIDHSQESPLTVLKPLRYPCLRLTEVEKEVVKDYISELTQSETDGNAAEKAQDLLELGNSSEAGVSPLAMHSGVQKGSGDDKLTPTPAPRMSKLAVDPESLMQSEVVSPRNPVTDSEYDITNDLGDMHSSAFLQDNMLTERTDRTVERTAVQPLTLHPTTQIQQSTINLGADVRMVLPGDVSNAEFTQTTGQIGSSRETVTHDDDSVGLPLGQDDGNIEVPLVINQLTSGMSDRIVS